MKNPLQLYNNKKEEIIKCVKIVDVKTKKKKKNARVVENLLMNVIANKMSVSYKYRKV